MDNEDILDTMFDDIAVTLRTWQELAEWLAGILRDPCSTCAAAALARYDELKATIQ